MPHPLLDGLDQRKPPSATADESVIYKLLGLRQTGDKCRANVRWFDFGSKDDTWEPLENLPRNMVVRFLRQKKKHVPGYDWQTPTRQSRRQAGLTTVAHIVMYPTWIPTIQHVHVTGDGVIHANVSWTDLSTETAIKEVIPVAWLKSTLPSITRNFAYDPQLALRHFALLSHEYAPHTYVWPKSAQSTLIGSDPSMPVLPNGFFCTPCTALVFDASTPGDHRIESNRGHPTLDQHQLVRYSHTGMFRVPSTVLSRCEGYESHTMGHADLRLPSSL